MYWYFRWFKDNKPENKFPFPISFWQAKTVKVMPQTIYPHGCMQSLKSQREITRGFVWQYRDTSM